MQIDTLTFSTFIGGQLEIQNRLEEYLFRGEIASACVESTLLKIRFAWCAKNDGSPDAPSADWTNDPNLNYEASLELYNAYVIDGGRLCFDSAVVGERCVFFPKGYTNLEGEPTSLDRARVKPSS
ncbi:hypothetical protein KBA73_05685 [Patescibacteria group bacterium]|nr:hypothetical protein [Patescibacteria group bacterium]